ncbi:beta-ketoacyl-ACP synthase II [Alkanindiges sp. WGS2144]|uniref:beta-ketoacyl-ACP synthase II n=1 Tax=Alkanindiges sp. WGS2144 TaxID=3366808 RepID=UPI00375329CF
MTRVVITGLGIYSCLGNDRQSVTRALQQGISGTRFNEKYAELGMRSQVSASASADFSVIDRKLKRFMGDASAFAYLSALDALNDAGLSPEQIGQNPRYGVVGGTGGASTATIVEAADILRERGARKVGATLVPRNMSNTITATIGLGLKLQGISHSISSACATSADAIGYAAQLIQLGKQDLMLAAGGEEDHWTQSILFDAMGAMSSNFNDQPETASRPYSVDRDGFVIAGGGGVVVVESLEHAQARGANILAEIVGYGASSDGYDMVAPSGEGAVRCMQMALDEARQHDVEKIDYINTHGTSTPIGDIAELKAIKEVFGEKCPPISSTKSMTGHSLGAAGVQEIIYCLLMMQDSFIAPSINISQLDPEAASFDIVQKTRPTQLNTVMSNSFGFGGTNASLIIRRWNS